MVAITPGPGCPSLSTRRAARRGESLPSDPTPPIAAGEPPPIGVREGVFADDDDEEWSDDGEATVAPDWSDRHVDDRHVGDRHHDDDDDDDRHVGGPLPHRIGGGGVVAYAAAGPVVRTSAAPVTDDLAGWSDRDAPGEAGGRSVREWLAQRFPVSLRGMITAPAARATLLLALVALAAALLASWFAWQHRPVSLATPIPRPSVVNAASTASLDGHATDAGTTPGQITAAAGAAGVTTTVGRTSAAGEVVVDVAGRVARPGVVRLPAGSRVVDAIDRVGGVLTGTDTTGIGLARVLVDGEQILVDGRPGPPPAAAPPAAGAPSSGQSGAVDLNSASSEQLDGLPGVGPVLAGRIVAWRTEHGPFRSPEQLGEVTGLGDKRLADLLPLVKV